jgi:hypothetical protein
VLPIIPTNIARRIGSYVDYKVFSGALGKLMIEVLAGADSAHRRRRRALSQGDPALSQAAAGDPGERRTRTNNENASLAIAKLTRMARAAGRRHDTTAGEPQRRLLNQRGGEALTAATRFESGRGRRYSIPFRPPTIGVPGVSQVA